MLARQKENTERINIFLPPDILQKLKEESSKKGTTVSGLIRMLIFEYLNK